MSPFSLILIKLILELDLKLLFDWFSEKLKEMLLIDIQLLIVPTFFLLSSQVYIHFSLLGGKIIKNKRLNDGTKNY